MTADNKALDVPAGEYPPTCISDEDRLTLAGALGLMRGHRYTGCADALQRVLDADRKARAAPRLAPVLGEVGEREPLHVTHAPLMREAASLLRLRKPVTPAFERVAAELESAIDGRPTPAGEPSKAWLDVADIAAAPVTRAVPVSVEQAAGVLSDEAYSAIAHAEETLAAIANRQHISGGRIERIGGIAAASEHARLALKRLQAVAPQIESANAAPAVSAPSNVESYASVTLSGDEVVFLSHLFNVLTMARAGRVFSPTCWDGDRWELADILRKSPDEGLKRDAVAAFPASRYEASRAAPAAKNGGEQS